MPGEPSILTRILDPLDETLFFRDYWARKPVVLEPIDRTRFDGIFDLSSLEEYLFVVRPPAGDVRLVRSGEWPPFRMIGALLAGPHYDVQAIYNGLGEGYSVVLNAVHYRWPPLWRLVADVEERLMARAQTNVYITGPKAQGFEVHSDEHDVFVLQTFGTKRWLVYDKPVGSAASGQDQRPLLEVELKCGDVLYLPIGFPHAASTTDGHSVHVSLGVFPLTWKELAHRCVDAVAALDATWSAPVPLPALGGAGEPMRSDIEDRLRTGLSKLVDLSSILGRRGRELSVTLHRRSPAPSGYVASLDTLDGLDVDSQIERRRGVACHVTTDDRSAYIHFMEQSIRAPRTATRALQFIAAHDRFAVVQIDDVLTGPSKVVLVRRLIREGLLQLAR